MSSLLSLDLASLKVPEFDMTDLSSVATAVAMGGAVLGTFYLVKNSIRYTDAPPGPKRVPLIGNIELDVEDGGSFNSALQDLCKKYGPVLCMYLGNTPIIVISDYALLREAFVTKGIDLAGRPDSSLILAYNPGYPNIKGILDASYSEEWKAQRNTAITILRNLGWGKSSIELKIQEESDALLEELRKKAGACFNPANLIGTCVANIICSLLFGQRFKYGDDEFKHLLAAIDELLNVFANDPGGDYISIMKMTPAYWRTRKDAMHAGGKLVEFYRKKIAAAKERLASGEEPTDFVSCYLSEIESLSKDTKIKEDWTIQHVSDFFLAGAETTATTLRWAFLHMANNQDVQEKINQEISSKIKKGQVISLKDREHLPYVDATIMEIQRIAALVPIGVPHVALVDTTIGEYKIPKGAEVWGNLYGVLKDPKAFPEPEKFKPERFLNDELDAVKRNENWVPFSLGRRTCLGEQLARQELFLFFSTILQSYKILRPEGVKKIEYSEVFKFVLKPSDYEVRLVQR